jgi:hypothetical protein
LKEMLSKVTEEYPYRGPHVIRPRMEAEFAGQDWQYTDGFHSGDIRDFRGRESIFYRDVEVFSQDYMGGLILGKQLI